MPYAARTFGRIAVLTATSLLLSSCYFLQVATEHQAASPDTRPWWCHSTGDGGGHGGHDMPMPMPMEKGMLSWEDCLANSAAFDEALIWAMQYPTAGDAEADGFQQMVPYAFGMGTHHARLGDFDITDPGFDPLAPEFPGTRLDADFDPNRPEFLQYDGNGPGAKLVGMSWYVHSEGGPPAGFAGHNDAWHVHERLCFDDDMRFQGQNLTDEMCEARGATNLHLDDYYMVHAWIVPGWAYEPDVFVNHHPCLQGRPIADPHHPCQDVMPGHG